MQPFGHRQLKLKTRVCHEPAFSLTDWSEMHVCIMSSKRYVTERAWRNCYSRHLEIISISVSTRMDKEIIYEGILQCNENEETIAVFHNMEAFYQTNVNGRQ